MTRLEQPVVDSRARPPTRDPCAAAPAGVLQWAAPAAERDRRRRDVYRAIETVIVARVTVPRRQDTVGTPLCDADVRQLVALLLQTGSQSALAEHVATHERRGVSLEAIYLGLLQPAARRIGELWGDDRCSFVDVTLAVGQLQTLLRVFAPRFHKQGLAPAERRKALLLSLPGDQHTFGLAMVGQFFGRAGWGVWSAPIPSLEALRVALTKTNFAVVGFSASGESQLEGLAAAIRTIRRHPCGRTIGVLAGGPLFVDHPHYAGQVGADAVGRNATQALAEAETTVATAAGS